MASQAPIRSRFVFYCTAPLLLVFIVFIPLFVRPPDVAGWFVLAGVELLAVMVLLGLFDSTRFWWCWRAAGALVFAGYVAYLVEMARAGDWFGDGRRAQSTAFNAAIGLVAFGLPGLWYALFGRLTLRAEREDWEGEADQEWRN